MVFLCILCHCFAFYKPSMLLIFEDLSCANQLLTMLTGTILVAKLHLKTPVFRVS